MKRIALPPAAPLHVSLSDALEKRSSYRSCTHDRDVSIPLETFSSLLGASLRKRDGVTNRNYPSGGALYPVETYMISEAIESLGPTVFHYNPSEHALEILWPLDSSLNLKDLARKPDDLHFSSLIVFTSVWKRSSAKYGDLSYTHALLEAGHMSENILLAATALSLLTRPMAGFSDTELIDVLDLNPNEEQPIHTIVLCR